MPFAIVGGKSDEVGLRKAPMGIIYGKNVNMLLIFRETRLRCKYLYTICAAQKISAVAASPSALMVRS